MSQDKRSAVKNFAKGSPLFNQGEPARHLYLVQTGLVSVSVLVPDGKVEIYQATAPQVVGVEALMANLSANVTGVKHFECSAFAANDTIAIQLPVESTIYALEKASPTLKIFFSALVNKFNSIHAELKNIKLQGGHTPCPPALISKLFATVFHVVSYSGTPKDGTLRIVWPSFRKYCQRVFSESPVRLEQLIYLLSTMDYVQLEMVKSDTDPDGPEELGFVRFKDISQIESFSEFFRKRLKNLGPYEAMQLNDPCLQAGEILLRAFNGKVGKSGEVQASLKDAIQVLKSELANPEFQASNLESLVMRGLPIEISGSSPNTKVIKFTATAFKRMFQNWRILAKIDEWNRTGRAPGAPNPEEKKKEKAS